MDENEMISRHIRMLSKNEFGMSTPRGRKRGQYLCPFLLLIVLLTNEIETRSLEDLY